MSVKNALDLIFLRSDAMGFVPMDFRMTYRTIVKFYGRRAFQLSPTSPPVNLPQPSPLADGGTGRNRLHVRNCADNFEVHARFTGSTPANPSGGICQLLSNQIT